MNELFNIFYSPKGRLGALWYFGLSCILFVLFFYIAFPMTIQLGVKWSQLTVGETYLWLGTVTLAMLTAISWVIISIKRVKDTNEKFWVDYFLPIFCMAWTIPILGMEVFYYVLLFLTTIICLILRGLKGSLGKNDFGLPFRFAFTLIGLSEERKPNPALLKKLQNHALYLQDSSGYVPVSFVGEDFSAMLLENTNFRGADLEGAKFDGANLTNSDFSKANIAKASFIATDLQNSNFDDCIGVSTATFSRANLSNSTLTTAFPKAKTLEQIGNLAKIIKPIFLGLLSACVYSWITIATIEDVSIISDARETVLPIIQVKIAVSGFFIAAPLILYFIFLYFNLYLRRLWQEVAKLPFILQDGVESILTTYPWLLISIGNAHFIGGLDKRHFLKKIEVLICIFLAWWVVPFTMAIFWIESLVKHDWWISSFLIFMFLGAIATALMYQIDSLVVLYKKSLLNKISWKFYGLLFLLGMGCFFYTYDGIEGIQEPSHIANLERAFLVPKPSGYIASSNKEKHKDIVGPNLSDCDLSFAKARGLFGVNTIFKKAKMTGIDLNSSHLTGSDFRHAELDFANFRYTQLQGADFRSADLDSANFGSAQLQGSDLRFVNLEGANFSNADLQKVGFYQSNLQGINFYAADLQRANFWFANLEETNFSDADLQGADFSSAKLQGVNFYAAKLQGVNFRATKLQAIDFRNAKLDSADFRGAVLDSIDFRYAKLKGADFWATKLDSAKVHLPYWLDSLVTWGIIGRETLQKKYYVDSTKCYEEFDRYKNAPFYYIKARAIITEN